MDEDIDIEEHDLFENPVIRNIFPDLTILKKEITGYSDEDPEIGKTEVSNEILVSKSENQNCLLSPDLSTVKKNLISNSRNPTFEYEKSLAEQKQSSTFSNKIILGSKPTPHNEIKVENQKERGNINATKESLNNTSNYFDKSDKHILTSQHKTIVNDQNEQEKIYSLEVHLSNIGPYLEKSQKFCHICCTLFPQKEYLDVHKITVHGDPDNCIIDTAEKSSSYGLPLPHVCNKCGKCFSRRYNMLKHIKNVHKIIRNNHQGLHRLRRSSGGVKMASKMNYGPNNKCFHCNKTFPSKPLLIDHIYNVLHAKKNNCETKLLGQKKIVRQRRRNKTQSEETPAMNLQSNFSPTKLSMEVSDKNKESNMSTNKQTNKLLHLEIMKSQQKSNVSRSRVALVYRCLYCSSCYLSKIIYLNHIRNKHRDMGDSTVKKVSYYENEQCKYCFNIPGSWRTHNVHIYKCHKEKIYNTFKIYPKVCLPKIDLSSKIPISNQNGPNNNITSIAHLNEQSDVETFKTTDEFTDEQVKTDSPFLKSILFKCNRCDINFMTSRAAMGHKEHMEMLIHWKCNSCLNIFKKHDAPLHEKQHLFSSNITVMELNAIELTRILYKCSLCGIHFNEDNYFSHFKTCEIITAESFYCKECDVLIDKYIARTHQTDHRMSKLKPEDFTIITTDVLTMESNAINTLKNIDKSSSKGIRKLSSNDIKKNTIRSTSSINGTKLNNKNNFVTNKSKSDRNANSDRRTKARTIKKKSKTNNYFKEVCFKLNYCETCKSFVSQLGLTRRVHAELRCSHIATSICKHCGLIFTGRAMYTHKIIHQRTPNLKLQDFQFYDMNGRQIFPPIPAYPKCEHCDVHFLSHTAILGHVCSRSDFLTCHVCNMKLSESVFKLHMSFHFYPKIHPKIGVDNMFDKADEKNQCLKQNIQNQHEFKYDELSPQDDVNLVTVENSTKVRDPKLESRRKTISDQDGKEPERPNSVIDNQNKTEFNKPETLTVDLKVKNTHSLQASSDVKSDYELFNILYCCVNCRTVMYTYDEVVEHCQDHLCGVEIVTEVCETLKLKFDQRSLKNHKRFHASSTNKSSLEIITFDTFYFNIGNDVWTRHIFESISEEKAQSILVRSVYQNCTIKMKIIQEGLPDLTVYKCNSCCIIVEPDTLQKHVENSCFKLRKHPCSFCGLPFLSYLARMKHENVHKEMNITLKSYRIVVFNQENDKKSNKLLNGPNKSFILYQCRNCSGIVDKFQSQNHICVKNDLKRCEKCYLMIINCDFKAHLRKHAIVPNYIQKNMKLILFGQKHSDISETNQEMIKSFGGIVVDYTFYQCVECEVCFDKSQIIKISHSKCYDTNGKLKCPKCDLVLSMKNYSRHSKLHETDADFVRANINIISYTVSKIQANFVPADLNNSVGGNNDTVKPEEINLSKTSLDTRDPLEYENVKKRNDETEKTTKLFKCVCGLHFLNNESIQEHTGHCKTKNITQTCSKCNLLFTPNVLFDHLLLHHKDKKQIYKYNVIEITEKKCKIVSIYNCVHCNTHFLEYENAVTHVKICSELPIDRQPCQKCNLFFDVSCISEHKRDHHLDNVADIDIIKIEECTEKCESRKHEENISTSEDITMLADVADMVIDSKKYNLSDETLSQIDLSHYDNCVFKCDLCNTHFLTEHTQRRHIAAGHYLSPQDTCYICGIRFSLLSLTKHIYIHHKQKNLKSEDIVIKSNGEEKKT